MGFSDEVRAYLLSKMTRSPYPFAPTMAMYIKAWTGDYVICFEPTESCPVNEMSEVLNTIQLIQLMMLTNLDCPGWRPHEFHRICNDINAILDGRALISVGQKWAFDDDEHWEDAKTCVRKNVYKAKKGCPFI